MISRWSATSRTISPSCILGGSSSRPTPTAFTNAPFTHIPRRFSRPSPSRTPVQETRSRCSQATSPRPSIRRRGAGSAPAAPSASTAAARKSLCFERWIKRAAENIGWPVTGFSAPSIHLSWKIPDPGFLLPPCDGGIPRRPGCPSRKPPFR